MIIILEQINSIDELEGNQKLLYGINTVSVLFVEQFIPIQISGFLGS